jgi:hypothetical protein
MSDRGWKLVEVVVYPPSAKEHTRMVQTVRLPYDAGFDDLLAALADASPDVFAEVCGCVARASSRSLTRAGDDPPLLTLDHYFALGGPVVCPDLTEGIR